MILSQVLAAALAQAGAAAPAQPAPSPPRAVVERPLSKEEGQESIRLERVAAQWAEQARQRHGLSRVHCSLAGPRRERTSCAFEADGVTAYLEKAGRSGALEVNRIFVSSRVEWVRGSRTRLTGAWIRHGDLIETEADGKVFTSYCRALDPLYVECMPFGVLTGLEARLSYPRARYNDGTDFAPAAARAFADGSIRMLRNGRPIDLRALIAAAQDFARTDFGLVARQDN
jgi:hypothetical protein